MGSITKLHWIVEDLGVKQSYVKPVTSQFNGKVKSFNLTDRKEFYQRLEYINEVNLKHKLKDLELL